MDTSTLLDQVLQGQELIDGLRNAMPNFDDKICTVKQVASQSGVLPYLAPHVTLGRTRGALAIGSDPNPLEFELSNLTYACKQYANSQKIPKSVARDLDQYMATMSEIAQVILDNNAIDRETALATLMTASGSNGQHAAAAGAWSLATSTPVKDMLGAKLADVPVVDLVVIGSTTATELMVHPDITAMAGLGYASGGAVPEDGLKAIVGRILGCAPANVHIWETFYNSAKVGATAVLARVTGDFFWMGQKKGLIKFAQTGYQNLLSLEEDHINIDTAVQDVCAFNRVNTYFGGEITGL